MSKEKIDETKVSKAEAGAAEKSEKAPKKPKNFKKLKYGSVFIVSIALVVAIVVVLNIMVSMLAKRSPIKIDLTPDNRYELSDETVAVLKNMDKDVEITVTVTREYFDSIAAYYERMYSSYVPGTEVPYDMIPMLLDKYKLYAEQGSGSVDVKYVDIDVDPDVLAKYNKYYSGDINKGDMIVYSNERVRVISGTDVINMLVADQNAFQSSGVLQFAFVGESTITSAIMSVVDTSPVSVAFIKTMNGQPLYNTTQYGTLIDSIENGLLTKNGYDCTDVDITLDELDTEKYDMVVLAVPSYDLGEESIAKLSNFLYNGGKYDRNMVYFPGVEQTNLPNIAEFLADWSIKVENSLILDDSYMDNTNIVLSVSDMEAVGSLPSETLPIVAPYAREISIIKKNNDDIVSQVLSSSDKSYTRDMLDQNAEPGAEGARAVAVLTKKQAAEQFNVYTSSLLVIGSSFMADDLLITQNNTYNNANVLVNMFNTMTGKESTAVIPDKNLQQSYIAPTAKEARNIKVIVIWVIPFIAAAIGVVVLLRRRNR